MPAGPQKDEIKEMVMAKVIEFYLPTRFQRPFKERPKCDPQRLSSFVRRGNSDCITATGTQR